MDAGIHSEPLPLNSNINGFNSPSKRKRSPSLTGTAPPSAKIGKSSSNHLTINYLARQHSEDLPLVSTDDSLPAILSLLNEYQRVLDRHESLACNLGARPIGPILMSRFDRLFDGPPTILMSPNTPEYDITVEAQQKVTWLDVVEFARMKPEQFQLSAMSDGRRVCQFYTKQCRVQISEDDFLLIQSGIPQQLIPPQPIVEDEEKELGTLEIMEKVLDGVREIADQVAARTRQINHRIRARKQAILDRRASENGVSYTATSPSDVAFKNGSSHRASGTRGSGSGTPVGFVAVNIQHSPVANGVSASTRDELLSKFSSLSDRRHSVQAMSGATESHAPSEVTNGHALTSGTPTPNRGSFAGPSYAEYFAPSSSQTSPLPSLGALPQSNHIRPFSPRPHNKPQSPRPSSSQAHKDDLDSQPHRATMTTHIETLKRGERIVPPCDRCRRLQMDCMKNLTACQGCTRKHARCSWKDVTENEAEVVRTGLGDRGRAEYSGMGHRDAPMQSPAAGMVGYIPHREADTHGGANGTSVVAAIPTANGVFTSEGISGVTASAGVEEARSSAADEAFAAGTLAATARDVFGQPDRLSVSQGYGSNRVARGDIELVKPAGDVVKSE